MSQASFEALSESLATALKSEFGDMLDAPRSEWMTAARGVLRKMGCEALEGNPVQGTLFIFQGV